VLSRIYVSQRNTSLLRLIGTSSPTCPRWSSAPPFTVTLLVSLVCPVLLAPHYRHHKQSQTSFLYPGEQQRCALFHFSSHLDHTGHVRLSPEVPSQLLPADPDSHLNLSHRSFIAFPNDCRSHGHPYPEGYSVNAFTALKIPETDPRPKIHGNTQIPVSLHPTMFLAAPTPRDWRSCKMTLRTPSKPSKIKWSFHHPHT
jgi:hypothetical protein